MGGRLAVDAEENKREAASPSETRKMLETGDARKLTAERCFNMKQNVPFTETLSSACQAGRSARTS